MDLFDRYVIVDWSASNRRRIGKDSIWICVLRADGRIVVDNPPTRGAAEAVIRDVLLDAAAHEERVLVGFDFPYGYPAGLAGALRLDGPPWQAVWQFLAARIRDDGETNRSNRFEVAGQINARLAHHAFWGRPSRQLLNSLSARRDRVSYLPDGQPFRLGEWREVEVVLHARGYRPHSTWKLLGAGSVGSQALTGIPVVARLRNHHRLAPVSVVWPFEVTVPELPAGKAVVVHAEVWPSLIDAPSAADQVKDQTQVMCLARELRRHDRAGTLTGLFAAPAVAAAEEGWILGVQ